MVLNIVNCDITVFFGIWHLKSGSFSYLRNSVCKYIRNSAEFRGIPANFSAKNTAKFRGIPRNSVCFSKNSVFRRKSKTHFRGHPIRDLPFHFVGIQTISNALWIALVVEHNEHRVEVPIFLTIQFAISIGRI